MWAMWLKRFSFTILALAAVAFILTMPSDVASRTSDGVSDRPDDEHLRTTAASADDMYLSLALRYVPPISTTFRYVWSPDGEGLMTLGCGDAKAAAEAREVIVVLAFGDPKLVGATQGTDIFSEGVDFCSMEEILECAKQYIRGYYGCATTATKLHLAVGTTNHGPNVTEEHGRAWAQLVNDLNAWIASPPSWADKVTARGAIDIEQDIYLGWSTPEMARAWAEGYRQVYTGMSLYYDFGSCDWCPFPGCPGCDPPGDWNLDHIWWLSFGVAPAMPLPLIYNNGNAQQWQNLAVWALENRGSNMYFQGSVTQWVACLQRGNCAGIDNTPEEGWYQFYAALNGDPRTFQGLPRSGDMSWTCY